MATPGTYISAVGHVGLIGWLILGWGLSADPLVFETMDVSVVTGEEFDALTQAARTPDPGLAEPTAPVPPEVNDNAPPAPVEDDTPTQPPPPPQVEQPFAEDPPPLPPVPLVTDVTDVPPIEPEAPVAPPPSADVDVASDPTPPVAPTVASTISEPPPPDAQLDETLRDEVVPDDTADAEIVEDPQVPTAPPATTTEIVIEDETPSGAVETSLRPQSRPPRPQPPVEEPEVAVVETETTPPDLDPDTIDDTLERLLAEAPAVSAGPPMTDSERDSFRIAVNSCWNVDPGSVAARVTVEVGFSLDRSGLVQGDVRLVASDGDQSATNTAFEAARRAILRCQRGGYQLPAEKYDQWKEVVITFDPSGMRLR